MFRCPGPQGLRRRPRPSSLEGRREGGLAVWFSPPIHPTQNLAPNRTLQAKRSPEFH